MKIKEKYYESVGEQVYFTRLSNGLTIHLIPKEDYYETYGIITTKFGSVDTRILVNGDERQYPAGIAHFLEHKVFVQKDDPQPMEFFAKSGSICNAYTTFRNTTYLFYATENLEENINYLLDYVQNIYLTPESVESEKGIIAEEIHMYEDRPNEVLIEKTRLNSLNNNPYRDSIIGTVKDIESITKEDLETCYHTFYHPSNMFIVVSGNFNVEKIMETIRENQRNKEFKELDKIKIKEFEEKDKVYKEKEIIKSSTPKAAYTIKIPLKNIKLTRRKLHLYLYILFTTLFDETSDFDQKLKEENIITSTTYVSLLNCNTHILISLINETPKYEEFLSKLKEKLETLEVKEADFNRKKKVLISNEMLAFESVETVNDIIIDNIIYDNKLEDNPIEIIKSLTYKELKELIKELDIKNTNTVIVKK